MFFIKIVFIKLYIYSNNSNLYIYSNNSNLYIYSNNSGLEATTSAALLKIKKTSIEYNIDEINTDTLEYEYFCCLPALSAELLPPVFPPGFPELLPPVFPPGFPELLPLLLLPLGLPPPDDIIIIL